MAIYLESEWGRHFKCNQKLNQLQQKNIINN